MARIQVLPLPTEKLGGAEHTPFILVIDEVNRFEEGWPAELMAEMKEATGAAFILAHEATLDAPGSLVLTDKERDQLREYLLTPRRVVLGTPQDLVSLPFPLSRDPFTPPRERPPAPH